MSDSSKRPRAGQGRPAGKQHKSATARAAGARPASAAKPPAKGKPSAKGKPAGAEPTGARSAAVEPTGVEPAAVKPAAGEEAAAGTRTAGGTPTVRLTLAAAVAGVEGLAVAAWGIATCFTGGHNAVPAGLLVLVFAVIPLTAAYGLRKARRWSRGPALIMQLISLPIAWTMMGSGGPAVPGGIVLGALAVTAAVLLVHPAATDALGIKRTASS